MSNSWYTVKTKRPKNEAEISNKTSCHFSQCLWQRTMEKANQRTEDEESEKPSKKRKKNPSAKKPSNKPPAGKAILYRLYSTSDQKQLLQQWFGVARWTYNKCLDAIKNLNKKSKKELREHCLNK